MRRDFTEQIIMRVMLPGFLRGDTYVGWMGDI